LRQAWHKHPLHRIDTAQQVNTILDQLMAKDWVVYSKNTCQHAETVVRYLSQYTHRIAISNTRLLAMDSKEVCFSWKDYADQGKRKVMTLKGEEFVRRFLQHILPSGFMRIRHYGFMANGYRKVKLALIHQCLKVKDSVEETKRLINQAVEQVVTIKLATSFTCPTCKVGLMIVKEELPRFRWR
ncbi:MAG: transposase, partial [Pseudomonadales bacterium]